VNTSIRTRLLLALFGVALVAAAGLSAYFLHQLQAYGVRKLEERVSGEAELTAAMIRLSGTKDEAALREAVGAVRVPPGSRIIVLDAKGTAIADTAPGAALGQDYAARAEVSSALAGTASRAQTRTPSGKIAVYFAQPIFNSKDRLLGVAYASGETFSVTTLLWDYRLQVLLFVALFVLGIWLVADLLSRWLTAPLADLERVTVAFAGGDHAVRAAPSGPRETRALATGFNAMADEVDGVVSELRSEERRTTQFVSDVSHELRTPLTAIRGAAETLLDGDVPPEAEERFLASIVAEAGRLSRLANDLLTLQRIEGATGEMPLRVVDLRTAAESVAAALAPLIEDRGVQLSISGEAPKVLGDIDRIQQVIANLVDNASRHVGAGGHVKIGLASQDRWAVLTVADDGPGIPPEDLPRLFDRFYRSQPSRDRSTGGAGLGLAIVRAIVGAHDGRIDAENLPGGGSQFRVRLPALPPEEA
jgi:two-component system OmpR family sensor kinase